MKYNNINLGTLFPLIFISILVFGCEDKITSESIYDPSAGSNPTPVITSVEPSAGKVFAGVDTVWINGINFSDLIADNFVFFAGISASIVSASDTQLTVIAPPVSGNNILIKVAVAGAFSFGEFPNYALFESVVELISFKANQRAFALAMDKDDTLFVSITKQKEVIVKLSPEGEEVPTILPDSTFTDYSPNTTEKVTGMKWGPDGTLYYLIGERNLVVVPPGGGNGVPFTANRSGFDGKVSDLDFDENNIVFAAGDGSAIYSMKQDGFDTISAIYDNMNFKALRVFDGYVYVAGIYNGSDPTAVKEGIWKNKIMDADGTLGIDSLVLDWDSEFGESGAHITSMVIAADGDLYIITNVGDAVTILHPDGRTESLYPESMPDNITNLTWGNGDYIYATRWDSDEGKSQILKIDMRKPGAPYYGRR